MTKKQKPLLNIEGNKLLIIISFLIGFVFFSPHILIPVFQKKYMVDEVFYTPLTIVNVSFFTVDKVRLAGKIKDAYDGHYFAKDPQLFEYKNTPTQYATFPFLVLGLLTHLTGSVRNTVILADLLLPPVIFLLLYILMFKIIKDKHISILFALVTIMGYQLLSKIYVSLIGLDFKSIISLITSIHAWYPLNYFARLPNAQFTFIPFLIAIISLYVILTEEKQTAIIIHGFSHGLLFYTYGYYYLFHSVSSGILLLLMIIKKKYKEAKKVFVSLSIAAFISIPYWIEYFRFKRLPYIQDLLSRNGIEIGRVVFLSVGESIAFIFIGLILIALYKKKRNYNDFAFCLSFILSYFLCKNINLFIGYNIESWHWLLLRDQLIPVLFFYMVYQFISLETDTRFISQIISKFRKYYKKVSIFVGILILLFGFNAHFMFSKNTYKSFYLPWSLLSVFEWLNENTKTDDVVLSSSIEIIGLIPTYTHNNNFVPEGTFSLAPTSEILDRLYIAYKIYDIPESHLKTLLSQDNSIADEYFAKIMKNMILDREVFERAYWSDIIFNHKYLFKHNFIPKGYTLPNNMLKRMKNAFPLGVWTIPFEVRKEILAEYSNYKVDFQRMLNKYKVDYILYGPHEKKIGLRDISVFPFLKETYKNEEFTIFKILKNKL